MFNEKLFVLARTLDFAGKILISITAIRVHLTMLKDHKLDSNVFKEIKHESKLGLIAIILLSLGFVLEILSSFL